MAEQHGGLEFVRNIAGNIPVVFIKSYKSLSTFGSVFME